MSDENKKTDNFEGQIETLFIRYREPVVQAAYRITGNREDAEEALQNVFLTLIERPQSQGEFCKNPKAYLYKAAINHALKLCRSRERRRLTDQEFDELTIPAPEMEPHRVDDIEKVRAAMATLSYDHREILHLHYYEGHHCVAIAKIQGKKKGHVLVDLLRARAALKKEILRQEKESERQKEKHERAGGTIHTQTFEG
jgi:RNA polymerase sigma factor (sigma-70 family)